MKIQEYVLKVKVSKGIYEFVTWIRALDYQDENGNSLEVFYPSKLDYIVLEVLEEIKVKNENSNN